MKKQVINNNPINFFSIVYLLFFISLPFVFNNNLADPILIPRQILFTVFLTVISIGLIKEKQLNYYKDFQFVNTALFKLLVLFSIAIILSSFQAIIVSESLYVISKQLLYILFFILTCLLLIKEKINIESILKILIIFNFLIIAFALFQTYQITIKYSNSLLDNVHQVRASFGNKNLLSSVLFICTAFITSGFYYLPKLWKKIAVIVFIPSLFYLWILQAKASMGAFAVFTVVFLIVLTIKRKDLIKNTLKSKINIGIMIISFIMIAGFALYSYSNKERFRDLYRTDSVEFRLLTWDNTVNIIKENPIFGVGAGNFRIHFSKYGLEKFDNFRRIQQGSQAVRNPHNDYLHIFSEIGIIGIGLYLAIFMLILYYTYKLINHSKTNKDKFFYSGIFALLIAYMFHSFADFPYDRAAHQILIHLIFSIIVYKYYSNFLSEKKYKYSINNKFILALICLVPIVYSFTVSSYRYTGEKHRQQISIARDMGDFHRVIREVDNSLNFFYQIEHVSNPIVFFKAGAYHNLAEYNQALKYFKKSYELSPYNITIINNLASTYAILQEFEQAKIYFNKALGISPNYREALNNKSIMYNTKGSVLFNNNNYDDAYSYYNKALELNPNNIHALQNRALYYARLDKNHKALEDYEKVIQINPKHVLAYNNKGNVLRKMNKDDEALKYYSKAIEVNENHKDAYLNRANIYRQKNKLDLALKDYLKIIEIDPSCTQTLERVGAIYLENQEWEKAIKYFDKTISINPNIGTAYHNRGNCKYRLNQTEAACKDWQKAYSLGVETSKRALSLFCN